MSFDSMILQRHGIGSSILSFLMVVIVFLMVFVGFLYNQNKEYRNKNRELIIQNDSVLSVNVELKAILNATQNEKQSHPTADVKVHKH
ncbi:MAG: hypothetical protein ICV51_17850 [Flavisolibacter sp.]|nr:hypothetical protein [Flavisolibacter sp.]MBD0352959.1 hypothetical protein [Flavisolibacter sp.]MBD0377478.1 hypothetical protein [Flavisolibacter sp.]